MGVRRQEFGLAELALQQVAQDETCIYCSKLVTRRFDMTRILPKTTALFETNKAGTGADISADGNFWVIFRRPAHPGGTSGAVHTAVVIA